MTVVSILLLVFWLGAVFQLWCARTALLPTTLSTSWYWATATACLWGTAFVLELLDAPASQLLDQVWYAVVVVSLCPGIAVLGAQRPKSRAWNTFVLWPLCAIFAWPALTVWAAHGLETFRAETPVLIGAAVVLIMGAGNYVSTRFAPAAAMYSLAVCLAAVSVSARWEDLAVSALAVRAVAFAAFCGALGLAVHRGRRAPAAAANKSRLAGSDSPAIQSTVVSDTLAILPSVTVSTPATSPDLSADRTVEILASSGRRGSGHPPDPAAWDRVWNDFHHWFGLVWHRRLMERVNSEADREGWTVRLTLDGFRPHTSAGHSGPAAAAAEQTPARAAHATRTLLRRFVEPEWIDARVSGRTSARCQVPMER